jgi:hypothetical protein
MRTPTLAALAFLLASCANDRTASTEVDNHVTTVAGVVVDGAPVAAARVVLRTPSGTVGGTTTADSLGRFAFPRVSTDSVWVVGTDSLVAVALPSPLADTLRISVNPVTSEVVRRLRRAGSLGGADLPLRDSVGAVVALRGLGAGLPWDSLQRPAAGTSPTSLVLLRLRRAADTDGISSVHWLERSDSTGVALFADPQQRITIARETALSGMGKAEAESWLGDLDEEQGGDSLCVRWYRFYDDTASGGQGDTTEAKNVSRDSVEAMQTRLLGAFADSLAKLVSDSGDTPDPGQADIVQKHKDAILLYVDPGHDATLDSNQVAALEVVGRDLVSASVFVLRHLRATTWDTHEELSLQSALLSDKVMAGVDLATFLNASDPASWLVHNRTTWPLLHGVDDLRALAANRGIPIDSSLWR